MKLLIVLFAFIGMIEPINSKTLELSQTHTLLKSSIDKQLNKNEALFRFYCRGIIEDLAQQKIHYSIDGKSEFTELTNDEWFEIKTTPGNHRFQFFYTKSYEEIHISNISIKSQHKDEYAIHFNHAERPYILRKPVIYLYPEEITDVSFQLHTKGKLIFTYPTYENQWRFKAHPSGDLTFNNETFSYLFWEAEQTFDDQSFDLTTGSIIRGENTVQFLEKQLDTFGFTSKEKADFITYWAPQMMNNENNLVHFVLNEGANQFAELSITPKPDHLYRFYLVWSNVENVENYYYLVPQLIEPK